MGDIEATLDAVLDELWYKLQNDARMPRFRDMQRSHVVDEPQLYPILFLEEGQGTNKPLTLSSRQHEVKVRIKLFVKTRDPVEGNADVKQRTLKILKALTETPDDQRLMKNGQALAMNVQCPRYGWGPFARDSRTSETVFAGSIDVAITLQV